MRSRVESVEVEYKDFHGEIQKGVFKQDPWSDEELQAVGVDCSVAQTVRDILASDASDGDAHSAIYNLYQEYSLSENDQTRFHIMDMLTRLRFLSGMLNDAPVAEKEGEEIPVFFDTDGSIRLTSDR